MKNKPRVLIIDFTEFFGGGQKFILNLSVCFNNEISLFYAIANEELNKSLRSSNVLRIDGRLKKTFQSINRINAFIKKNDIEIVVLNGNRPIYFSLAFSNKVKKIAYKHTSNNAFNGVVKKSIASFFLNINYIFCQKIILLYNKAKSEVFFNRKSVYIIPNFIIPSHYQRSEHTGEQSEEIIRVTCISRLDSNKGIDWLLNCFSEVQNKVSSRVELIIAGDGPDKDKLEAICASRKIKNVTFLGFIDSVDALLRTSNIFILPSRFESFPLTLLEAMSCKLPIIATSTGGISELIEHNVNGFLVNFNDSSSLNSYLIMLIQDKERRIRQGEASFKKFQNQFSIDHFKERFGEALGTD